MVVPEPETHDLQDISIADVNERNMKTKISHEEHQEKKGPVQQMRTKSDDLPIWETIKTYKLVTLLAFAASFSAALDGYRE